MSHVHLVSGYETVRRIAALYGVDWSAIWNDGRNAELRRVRTPDHLREGDRVWVPGAGHAPIIEIGTEPVPLRTGRSHVLSAPQMHDLVVQFRDEADEPMGGWECTVAYPGGSLTTSFGGAGTLRCRVPIAALCVDVMYWPAGGDRALAHRRTLHVGRLDPIETDEGVEACLRNLGYGTDGCALSTAVREFQRDQGMEATGTIEEALRARLRSSHRAGGDE
jgi:hypothetical protein